MNTLHDVSRSLEAVLRRVYGEVAETFAGLGIEFVVIGAAARDLVLHHVHKAPIRRATTDIDFALLVADWPTFERAREGLVARGFTGSKTPHRLISPAGTGVDIIPFGPIADSKFDIAWPPPDETTMSVRGFDEAYSHAELIRIRDDPPLDIRVATPVGLAVLKLIAWQDRSRDQRSKDAQDLLYLLTNYDRIPEVADALFSDSELGERHGWDTQLMAAELLGRRAGAIAQPDTARVIADLVGDEEQVNALVLEMADWKDAAIERSRALLMAFRDGFLG